MSKKEYNKQEKNNKKEDFEKTVSIKTESFPLNFPTFKIKYPTFKFTPPAIKFQDGCLKFKRSSLNFTYDYITIPSKAIDKKGGEKNGEFKSKYKDGDIYQDRKINL